MRLLFFVVYLCIGTALGLIEPIPLPASLENCINNKVDLNNGSGLPLHVIQTRCLSKYILYETPHNWARNLTAEEETYIQSLLRKVIAESEYSITSGHRWKREVKMQKRYRCEIRSGSYKHWDDYAKAVRRLKYKEIGPNGRSRYDTIADIHMTAINSAHFGPNFLSWHRLYLLVFETALGVPIPYWDSTIDYEMEDPTKSILWTKKYFGNGFGMVKTGPFANFQTPSGPLIRNIGSDGSLLNKRDLNEIFTRSRLYKILEPTAEERVSFEGQHNSVHNWVDGQMNTQEFSPHDPLFWTHHAFVDYVWEEFRKIQMARGIDPTIDIPDPPENVTFQGGNDPSVGLFGFYNRDGYSTRIAKMVKYEPHPECPKCGGVELACNYTSGLCVSLRRHPLEYIGSRMEAQEIADDMIEESTGRKRGNVFAEYMRDDRVRGDSLTIKKKQTFSKYSLGLGGVSMDNSLSKGSDPLYSRDQSFHKRIGLSNMFHGPGRNSLIHLGNLNHIMPMGDPRLAAHRPVFPHIPSVHINRGPVRVESVVVYPHNPHHQLKTPFTGAMFNPYPKYITDMRSRGDSMTMNKFIPHIRKRRSINRKNVNNNNNGVLSWKPALENTFFLDGKRDIKNWAFVPVRILFNNNTNSYGHKDTNKELQTVLGNVDTKCNPFKSPRVYIQSHGLDYFGKYKDYTVIQNGGELRVNFVGIKKPSGEFTETYLSAYDSCGNLCNTRCVVPGIYPRVYKSCAGAVRASTKEPLMYKNYPNDLYIADSEIPIIFVCDAL